MKKKIKFFILLLICSLLLSLSFITNSTLEEKTRIPELKAIETPPVILFNLTDMSSSGILRILVYDTDTNLSTVDVYHNNVWLNISLDFNVTWSYKDYGITPPPLSLKIYPDADPGSDTFEGEIDINDVFVEGDHNNITVIAENLGGFGATANSVFCREVECWGGGGGYTPVVTQDTLAAQSNIPDIIFDLSCYFTCNRIHTYIEGNGAVIEAYNMSKMNETLKVWAYTDENVEYVAGVLLDPAIDIYNVTCYDCECPQCEECEECEVCEECEECPDPIETPYQFIPILVGLVSVATILTIRKRKK